VSLWTVLLANKAQHLNAHYCAYHTAVLMPIITKAKLNFWQEAYFTWHDRLWLYQQSALSEAAGLITANQSSTILFPAGNTLANTMAQSGKSVVWLEDSAVIACMKCNRAFYLFRRRHHCRCCGLIYCDLCCRELRLIPAISSLKACR
jgi:hypothetical protein